MACCCTKGGLIICLALPGALLCVIGPILLVFWPTLNDSFIRTRMQLAENNSRYETWIKTPVPVYDRFYVFNVTNVEAVINDGKKPILAELGPYTFSNELTKDNVVFNDNGTVTYQPKKTRFFVQELSSGTMDDELTVINPVATMLAHLVRHNFGAQLGLNVMYLTLGIKMLRRVKVGEYLFDGYEDDILKFMSSFPAIASRVKEKRSKFAFLYNTNGTVQARNIFNIETGSKDMSTIGKVNWWNYASDTGFHKPPCSSLSNVYTSDMFPFSNSEAENITIYLPEICRKLFLAKTSNRDIDGVFTTVYKPFSGELSSTGVNHSCYCVERDKRTCPPDGISSLSLCQENAPLFVSYPHFFEGNQYYRDNVVGLQPNQTLHQTELVIQPNLGVPLIIRARFQINLLLERNSFIGILGRVPKKLFLPVMWVETTYDLRLNDAKIAMMRFVRHLPLYGRISFITLSALGFSLLLVGLILMWKSRKRSREDEGNPKKSAGSAQEGSHVKNAMPITANGDSKEKVTYTNGVAKVVIGEGDNHKL